MSISIFHRLAGTWPVLRLQPAVETAGCFRMSLRDLATLNSQPAPTFARSSSTCFSSSRRRWSMSGNCCTAMICRLACLSGAAGRPRTLPPSAEGAGLQVSSVRPSCRPVVLNRRWSFNAEARFGETVVGERHFSSKVRPKGFPERLHRRCCVGPHKDI